MARERISLYTPRFCYRQATGHTPNPHENWSFVIFHTTDTVCIKFRHIYTNDTVTYPVKQTNGYVAEIRNSPHSSPLHLYLAALSAQPKSTATRLSHTQNNWEADILSSLSFCLKWQLTTSITPNSRSRWIRERFNRNKTIKIPRTMLPLKITSGIFSETSTNHYE